MLTAALGTFVAELSRTSIPDAAMTVARLGFIDCIGVMIAGSREAAVPILAGVVARDGQDATLLHNGQRTSVRDAALVNGTAAHALDFDDVAMRAHPSAVLVPAILAEAEALDLGGEAMLTAYVAGFEIWAELFRQEAGYNGGRGWHRTGSFGAIAAAAACASLRRFDAGQAAQALSLGASQSGGLTANFGSMTKPFHAGRAAEAGVLAARLVAAGFTASSDALEHPLGFLNAMVPDEFRAASPRASVSLDDLALSRLGLNIKRYPTCYATHRVIDGTLELAAAEAVDPDAVASVSVTLSETFSKVLRNHAPKTALEAKFSVEFAVAAALTQGRVGLRELDEALVLRPDIQKLMARVGTTTNTDYDPDWPGASRADQVSLTLGDGRVLAGRSVCRPVGHADRPVDAGELRAKFEDCITYSATGIDAGTLFAALNALPDISARQLVAAGQPRIKRG